ELDAANAVAIDTNGKILVGGNAIAGTDSAPSSQFALVRYNANGTLDTTFGPTQTGISITPKFATLQNVSTSLALHANGKIILPADKASNLRLTDGAVAVAQYTATGTLDTSFGVGGIKAGLAPVGATARANAVVVQSNGTIVVAGRATSGSSHALLLARVTA